MTASNFAILQVDQVRLAVAIVEPGDARPGVGDVILSTLSQRIPGYPIMLVSATAPGWQGIETYAAFQLPRFQAVLMATRNILWMPIPQIDEPPLPF